MFNVLIFTNDRVERSVGYLPDLTETQTFGCMSPSLLVEEFPLSKIVIGLKLFSQIGPLHIEFNFSFFNIVEIRIIVSFMVYFLSFCVVFLRDKIDKFLKNSFTLLIIEYRSEERKKVEEFAFGFGIEFISELGR